MEIIRRGFQTIGFKGTYHLGLMDPRHILIRFEQEEDFHRCWLHDTWSFRKHIMRVLKWTPSFSPAKEPPVVPVWVSLEQLPLYLFRKGPLFSIGTLLSFISLRPSRYTLSSHSFYQFRQNLLGVGLYCLLSFSLFCCFSRALC